MVKAKDMGQKKICYDEKVLATHPFAQKWNSCCLKHIVEILVKEGHKQKSAFKKEKAIDLDAVEIELNKGIKGINKGRTVDFVTGLSDNTLLLVEAKFRAKTALNIRATDIRSKITHSIDILRQDYDGQIATSVFVLFEDGVYARAKNQLKRQFGGNPNIHAISTAELYNLFFAR